MKVAYMNIPNWLSLFRIFLAPVLIALMIYDEREIFSWLLLFGFFSDMLDGYIARKFNITTDLGARLDSAGDATLFMVSLAGIAVFETTFVMENLSIILIAFIPYLLQLGYAYYRYGKPSSLHTYLAKLSALIQGLFILSVFFFGIYYWFFYLAVAISIIETLEEIIIIYLLKDWRANVKGLYWVLKDLRTNK